MQPATARYREREILEARFHADVRVYCDAVDRLDSCSREGFSREEFDVVYDAAERARTTFKNADIALNKHIAEHGCG